MALDLKDNKGNTYNIGLINNTMQNNVDLTLENKAEIKTGIIEFAKALFGNATYKFIGNFKLNKAKFEKEIYNELEKLDTKKIVEPRLSVVGPTIENLKYTLDEEQIRKMYIKLLIGELNQDTHSKVLPAYIEIIKQISREDALFLKSLNEIHRKQLSLLCVRAKSTEISGGYIKLDTIVVVHNDKNVGHTIHPKTVVLENLERLNIIKLRENIALDGEEKSVKNAFNYYKSQSIEDLPPEFTLDYVIGSLEITDFGLDFIDICCS